MWEVKKYHDFYPRDIESCHHAAARCAILRSINANIDRQKKRKSTKKDKDSLKKQKK